MELVDLENGQSIEVASFENPQRFGGSDVMYRISYDREHPRELRQAILRSINRQIAEWSAAYDVHRHCIYEIVVAGNSTMREILFRYDVQSIGQKPYKSQVEPEYLDGNDPIQLLLKRHVDLACAPIPKPAYTACLSSLLRGCRRGRRPVRNRPRRPGRRALLIDVGTNTEV